jgi:hypothetical protein
MSIPITDTPAKTPRPIGRTWIVLPGGLKGVEVGEVSAAAPATVLLEDELELGIRVPLPEEDGEGWLVIDEPPDSVGDGVWEKGVETGSEVLEEPCET